MMDKGPLQYGPAAIPLPLRAHLLADVAVAVARGFALLARPRPALLALQPPLALALAPPLIADLRAEGRPVITHSEEVWALAPQLNAYLRVAGTKCTGSAAGRNAQEHADSGGTQEAVHPPPLDPLPCPLTSSRLRRSSRSSAVSSSSSSPPLPPPRP